MTLFGRVQANLFRPSKALEAIYMELQRQHLISLTIPYGTLPNLREATEIQVALSFLENRLDVK